MDSSVGQSLYPLHRCKTIHLVRHAQGIHNVQREKNRKAYQPEEFFDANITPLGWNQVANLKKHVDACGLSKKIELVIASPLLRTMQTAAVVFGGEGYMDGIDAPPLMVANTGKSIHPAISSLNCPPFIAVELCRERMGVHPFDRRRSISEYKHIFPAIDFSMIESDADILWKPDTREKDEELATRGMKFLNWTMQTAVGVFGGEGYMDGIDVPPLMVANAGKSSHPAISSLNCPPFIAVELCRERLGVNPCDRRRSISEYKSIFPAINFSMIESDADILWKPGPREKDEQLAARGMKFLNWLWTRPEKEIAIVTHSAFLVETLSAFGNDCHPSIKSEICKSFNNCELRSLVIVDKGMLGSDSSTTNYPGKIPSGADLPSDVAKEKHPASGVPT